MTRVRDASQVTGTPAGPSANIQYVQGTSAANLALANQFCNIKRFITVDTNLAYEVRDGITAFLNVGNVFDARAPIAPGAYASAPNFLTTFHYAGLIGRTFKAGVRFSF